MADYQRITGTNEVYDLSGGAPRYISYDEAMKNNIWSQVKNVSSIAGIGGTAPTTATPTTTSTTNITANQMQPAQPFNLPTYNDTTNWNSILAGTMTSLPQPVNPEAENVKQAQSAITSTLQELQGQEAYAQQQNELYGVNTNAKALKDLQAQLLSVNTEAQQQQLELGKAGQPAMLTAEMARREGNIERDRTIKALGLSAQIQAVQGNLQLALDQAQRAVDLRFKPMQQKLELLQTQLQFNYKSFDAEERKIADQLDRQYDMQKVQLNMQIEAYKDFQEMKLNALSNQMPANIATQAEQLFSSGQTEAAYALLAKYSPSTAKEGTYEYAKSQGFTGSYLEWEKLKATQFGTERSGGGGTDSTEEKEITAFRKDAADLIEKLGADKISWGTAWNSLHSKYPSASNELIDSILMRDAYKDVDGLQ